MQAKVQCNVVTSCLHLLDYFGSTLLEPFEFARPIHT